MTRLSVATLLCFAFVLVGFTSANKLQFDKNDVDLEQLNTKLQFDIGDLDLEPAFYGKRSLKININRLIDLNIKVIRSLLQNIDPLKLLRIPLLGKGSLSNGSLNNLSNIYRPKNCTLQYENRVLSVDLNVGWDDINIHYDYDFKLWLIQRYGTITGGISTLKINLAVGIDLARFRVVLQSLKFSEVGKFSLKIEGSVGDKIRTFFVKLIMNLLKKQIVSRIEDETVNTLRTVVDEVNQQIPNHRRQFRFSYPNSARQLAIDEFQSVEVETSSGEVMTIY